MEERRFQSGDAVIEEGGPGDFFYVTGSGELEVKAQLVARTFRLLWPNIYSSDFIEKTVFV